jgi:DNA-binding response OmpR family regulator
MPSILLIDDTPCMLEMFEVSLASAGYLVFVARGGLAGLKMCNICSFDFVITEMLMQDANGLEVIANLKMKKACPKIIVLHRGSRCSGEDPLVATAGELGADRILPQPVSATLLMECLRELGMEQAEAQISKEVEIWE